MDQLLDVLLGGLGVFYEQRWIVPFVFLPIMVVIAAIIRFRAIRRTKPFLQAADERLKVLSQSVGNDSDPSAERDAFTENYIEVCSVMAKETPGAHSLVQAWREFQESIVDETTRPIRNTNRPLSFFHHAAPKQTTLTFASNVFVGAGLILTFIGLIVALDKTAKGMSGGDVAHAQIALTALMRVAGAKFFTSVGGIGCSIWLRSVEHHLTHKVRQKTEAICAYLERGLLYVPPQRLAVEQLEVMREQRDQLKFFNTDVAMQLTDRIGQQFQQVIAPVAASLNSLNENMASVTSGIGAGAAEAIERVSGEQLRGLSETLGLLSQKLDQIGASVGSSGDEASRQIRLAGEDFAKAAADIREAFDRLAGQVDGMGGKLTEQGEALAKTQDEAIGRVLSGLEDAQAKSAEAIQEAVRALQGAGVSAAETMQKEVAGVLAAGVAESQKTFQIALEESGGSLKETATGLANAVGKAAEQVEKASASFVRSGEGAQSTADAMAKISDEARSVAITIGESADGFSAAAAPVATAAQAVSDAATRLTKTVEAGTEADAKALQAMTALAEDLSDAQQAAQEAWDGYRARFENVDKSLENTVVKLGGALGDSFDRLNKFAVEFDTALAGAVAKLSGNLAAVEDHADGLEETTEALKRYAAALDRHTRGPAPLEPAE